MVDVLLPAGGVIESFVTGVPGVYARRGTAAGVKSSNWQRAELWTPRSRPYSARIINDVYCNHAAGDRLRRR